MRRDPASWGEFFCYNLMAFGVGLCIHLRAYDMAATIAMIAIRYMFVTLREPKPHA